MLMISRSCRPIQGIMSPGSIAIKKGIVRQAAVPVRIGCSPQSIWFDRPLRCEHADAVADVRKCSNSDLDKQSDVYFPWRHESTPPGRFHEKDDLSGMPNNFRARFLRRLLASRELNRTTLEAFPLPFGLVHSWEEDLACNFATAFGLALDELLMSVFRGTVEVKNNIGSQGGAISIDSSIRNESTTHQAAQMGDGEEGGDDYLTESDDYLNKMLDKSLLKQFTLPNHERLHLKLTLRQPIKATLQSIFVVPLLSRDITFDLANEIGNDKDLYTRTVVADALITCNEFFQVKDALTGAVVQGMEDDVAEEETVHSVRFEVVSQGSRDGSGRKLGSWKIIDIDDMLDGNVFH
ncbi:hypothetical protein ACHAWF_007560 [Thalassiosira exigua]